MGLYFDASKLGSPTDAYVAWIDIMGTQSVMSTSVDTASNFIFKFHEAIASQNMTNVELLPVLDGVYATTLSLQPILDLIRDAFWSLMDLFVNEPKLEHRFAFRAALAYGPIYFGKNVSSQASRNLSALSAYKSSLLVGIPIIQAYLSERKAPPFGVYVHESARAFAPAGVTPLHFRWWKWYSQQSMAQNGPVSIPTARITKEVDKYFDSAKKFSLMTEYEIDRIDVHRKMASAFFSL